MTAQPQPRSRDTVGPGRDAGAGLRSTSRYTYILLNDLKPHSETLEILELVQANRRRQQQHLLNS